MTSGTSLSPKRNDMVRELLGFEEVKLLGSAVDNKENNICTNRSKAVSLVDDGPRVGLILGDFIHTVVPASQRHAS